MSNTPQLGDEEDPLALVEIQSVTHTKYYTISSLLLYFLKDCYFSWQILKCSPNNYLTNTWWNPLFNFLERNVQTAIPCSYSWPITWPPACLKNPCKKYSMVQSTREEWCDPDASAVLPDNPLKWYLFILMCLLDRSIMVPNTYSYEKTCFSKNVPRSITICLCVFFATIIYLWYNVCFILYVLMVFTSIWYQCAQVPYCVKCQQVYQNYHYKSCFSIILLLLIFLLLILYSF